MATSKINHEQFVQMWNSNIPIKEIANFFANYKVLQGISVEVGEYKGREEALKIIEECRKAYIDSLTE